MRALVARAVASAIVGMGAALPLAAQSTRDSAGVRIVENARSAWTSRDRLRLEAAPQLVIGDTVNAPYRFRQVRGVFRLRDGRIAVADGGSLQLRFFTADGRFLSASAGRGDAPGQLLNMGIVRRLRGDTIAISSSFATLSRYTSEGTFAGASSPPIAENAPPSSRQLLLEVLATGRRVVTPLPRQAPRALGTRWVDSITLHLLNDAGAIHRTVGAVPFLEMEQVRSGPMPPWLSAIGVVAGGDDHLYAGFGDRYAIHVYTDDGTLRSIIRRAWTPTPVTPEEWEQWVVEWSKLWVKEQGVARDSAVDAVRRAPYAEVLPAFTAFLVDRVGRLWVRGAHWQDAIGAGSLTDLPAVPSQWSVFDPAGRWLGDVEMPADFQPYEIGADYVVGKARRAGVNQVVLYGLRRGAP